MTKKPFSTDVKFESAPNTSKMNRLSEEDVERLLATIPKTKFTQGVAVLKAMDARDDATEKYKKELAIKRLYASENKEGFGLGSDKDREAWASSQQSVIDLKKLESESILRVKYEEYKYQYLDDLFISVRKQANRYEKALDTDMQNAKYGR